MFASIEYYADVNAVPGFKEHGHILPKFEKKKYWKTILIKQ